jgi:hypothetical protein
VSQGESLREWPQVPRCGWGPQREELVGDAGQDYCAIENVAVGVEIQRPEGEPFEAHLDDEEDQERVPEGVNLPRRARVSQVGGAGDVGATAGFSELFA